MDSNNNDFFEKLRSVDENSYKRILQNGLSTGPFAPGVSLIRAHKNNFEDKKKAILKENGPKKSKTPYDRLLDRVEALERKIDQIFGDHVLIDGQWVSKKKILEHLKNDGHQ